MRANVATLRLPPSIRQQIRIDRAGLPSTTPAPELVIDAAIHWLCRAQDKSTSADGGVARDYSLRSGWSSSYPETTGYIVPTLLEYAAANSDTEVRGRAQRMLEWFSRIQMPNGGFQGGKIDSTPVVPVPFNTGQILLGLAAGEREFGAYRRPMQRAADWLVQTQDPDGCWRKFPTPFAASGDKTYDTHIAWALLEAARIDPNRGYAEAAIANVRWALTHQLKNGWIDCCCLTFASRPLTHTIGYALRGVLEAYRFTRDPELLKAARRTADGVLTALASDGFLPGMLANNWAGAANWACLTGTAQIAYCWLALYEETNNLSYLQAGFKANAYVRRTVVLDGPEGVRGAVRGSFPIDGEYSQYAYPSWAAKFLVDSLVLERYIRKKMPAAVGA